MKNHYQKEAEDIYRQILLFKAQGDTLAEIEASEEEMRKNRIACIRVAMMNHDNKLKQAIFRNVFAFFRGFLGKQAEDIKISIHTTIARTSAEDFDE